MRFADRTAAGVGIIGLLMAVATIRIVSTYAVFSQTIDEPAHIAAGMQWLDRGRFEYEPKHPPLARVAVALGPYLAGLRAHDQKEIYKEGNLILEDGGRYTRNLALARAGILPFFLLACCVVALWSYRLFGTWPAVVSVALFTQLPPILAHSGLATTDMSLAATLPLALLMFVVWLERPTTRRTVLLAVLASLAVLSKISAVVLFPACAIAIVATRWLVDRWVGRPRLSLREIRLLAPPFLRLAVIAGGVALVTIWAAYRFSIPHPRQFGGRVPFPGFEFLYGLYQIQKHNALGQPSYLLGERGETGWWYFFPVTLLVKTPIPFLLLTALGLVLLAREIRARPAWQPLAPIVAAAVVLAVSMTSTINNGVRHVLPLYTLLAAVAGYGAVEAWKVRRYRVWSRAAVSAMVAWLAISSARAHPDYLAYFNEIAGDRPERIVVDSDLCWGQDYFRLVDAVRERGLDTVWVAYHGSLDVERHRLPAMLTLPQNVLVSGWVAVTARELKGVRYHGYRWVNRYKPVARIGKSISLFYIPPGAGPAPTPRPDAARRPDLTEPPGLPKETE